MIYAIIISSFFILSLIPKIQNFKYLYLIPITILTAAAFFRGEIGTDTKNYEIIFQQLIYENESPVRDIFFVFYGKINHLLNVTPEIATRFISIIISIIFISYIRKADTRELYFIICIMCIGFSINFSFNTLRIGIAILFFLKYTQESNKKTSLLYLILSITSHSSIIIAFILHHLCCKKIKTIHIIMLCLISLSILASLTPELIKSKIDLYQQHVTPEKISGLSRLPIFFLLMLLSLKLKNKKEFITTSTICYLSSIYLIYYSYAFLRITEIIFITTFSNYVYLAKKQNINFTTIEKIFFLVSGLALGAFFITRNIINPNPDYIPYDTY